MREAAMVDENRVAGSAKKVGGNIKEAAGKALGDKKMQSEGRAKEAEGEVQNAVGSAKDKIRETVKEK